MLCIASLRSFFFLSTRTIIKLRFGDGVTQRTMRGMTILQRDARKGDGNKKNTEKSRPCIQNTTEVVRVL